MRYRFAALAAALTVAGCAPRPATTALQVIEIDAGNFFFHAPDTVRAGRTEFRMKDLAGHHVMVIARLDSGKTIADAIAVPDTVSESPAWMADQGGPVSGDSNGVAVATLDLTPGRWILYCYFSDTDHVSHYAKGMIHEFIVTGPASTMPAPEADVIVTVKDFGYELSRPVTAGRHTIRFVNAGHQSHEIIMDRLNEGAHLEQWVAARVANTPRPGRSFGGIGNLPAGHSMDMTADFTPGNYLWFCVFTDEATNKNHAQLGMIKEVRVD